jgi:hypothetical protein
MKMQQKVAESNVVLPTPGQEQCHHGCQCRDICFKNVLLKNYAKIKEKLRKTNENITKNVSLKSYAQP